MGDAAEPIPSSGIAFGLRPTPRPVDEAGERIATPAVPAETILAIIFRRHEQAVTRHPLYRGLRIPPGALDAVLGVAQRPTVVRLIPSGTAAFFWVGQLAMNTWLD